MSKQSSAAAAAAAAGGLAGLVRMGSAVEGATSLSAPTPPMSLSRPGAAVASGASQHPQVQGP